MPKATQLLIQIKRIYSFFYERAELSDFLLPTVLTPKKFLL